jgi:hypothetical protein
MGSHALQQLLLCKYHYIKLYTDCQGWRFLSWRLCSANMHNIDISSASQCAPCVSKHTDTSDMIHTKRSSNMEHFWLYNTEPLIRQTYEKYEKVNKVYIIYVSPIHLYFILPTYHFLRFHLLLRHVADARDPNSFYTEKSYMIFNNLLWFFT